eukprot:gene50576-16526_t
MRVLFRTSRCLQPAEAPNLVERRRPPPLPIPVPIPVPVPVPVPAQPVPPAARWLGPLEQTLSDILVERRSGKEGRWWTEKLFKDAYGEHDYKSHWDKATVFPSAVTPQQAGELHNEITSFHDSEDSERELPLSLTSSKAALKYIHIWCAVNSPSVAAVRRPRDESEEEKWRLALKGVQRVECDQCGR